MYITIFSKKENGQKKIKKKEGRARVAILT
jgi:hypothetical protein